jgi:hypothetical protein
VPLLFVLVVENENVSQSLKEMGFFNADFIVQYMYDASAHDVEILRKSSFDPEEQQKEVFDMLRWCHQNAVDFSGSWPIRIGY